jgi:hypothetical protein
MTVNPYSKQASAVPAKKIFSPGKISSANLHKNKDFFNFYF